MMLKFCLNYCFLIGIGLLASLYGCSGGEMLPSRSNYSAMAAAMVGGGITKFMLRHTPSNIIDISDNHKIMTFILTQKNYPDQFCNVQFAVEEGLVSGYKAEGNGCK